MKTEQEKKMDSFLLKKISITNYYLRDARTLIRDYHEKTYSGVLLSWRFLPNGWIALRFYTHEIYTEYENIELYQDYKPDEMPVNKSLPSNHSEPY